MSSNSLPETLKSIKSYAVFASIQRALGPHLDSQSLHPGIFVLLVPASIAPEDYEDAVEAIGAAGLTAVPAAMFRYMVIKDQSKTNTVSRRIVEAVTDAPFGIVVATDIEHIPGSLRLAVDHVVQIPSVSDTDLASACLAVLQKRITKRQAQELLKYRLEDVAAALRPGRPIGLALKRLRSLSSGPPLNTRGFEVTSLDQMVGYGSAQTWGLQLARDLTDWRSGKISWSDVDSGLLLSGPPGCGKTIFAAALAKTCDVSLIATSAAQWQAAGHLGDFLKTMRAGFRNAVEQAPSILFIDEVDSIGDRQSFTGEHKSYSVQVVNGLLEAMDGVSGREGVVVIGATNFPEALDAALTRPGRLDKHVHIPLPDRDARLAILQQHVGIDLNLECIPYFAGRTHGMSGADLAQLARNAKRQARVERRSVEAKDVAASLPAVAPVTGAYRKTLAYHEAGHALIGIRLNFGKFVGVSISPYMHSGTAPQQIGSAQFRVIEGPYRDRQYYLNFIATMLAGMAAERLVFGTFGDGWAIGFDSDLGRATLVATTIEASFGMGSMLTHINASSPYEWERIRRGNPYLTKRVHEILQQELARATAMLEKELPFLHSLADVLDREGMVTHERFQALDGCTSLPSQKLRRRRAG